MKNWSFNKISKRDIKSGFGAWSWNLMILTRSHSNKSPSLEAEFEGVFVGGEEVVQEEVHFVETMTSEGKGPTNHEKMEYIKLIQPIFYDRTMNMNQIL